MIHEAHDQITSLGFSEVQQVEDNYGTIGYVVSFIEQKYVLVAKEYAYDDLASFMARLVVHANDDVDFIFYCGDDDRFTVFDGRYLKEHAEESHGKSKMRDASWREIPRSDGAELHAFIRNDESPATLSGGNETLGAYTS